MVLDLADARRRPCRALGFLAFKPGIHGALEDDLAIAGLHLDIVGIDLGATLESLFNLAFDFVRRNLRLDFDRIDDTLDSFYPAYRFFRSLFLVIPLHVAFERNPSVGNR